MKKVLLLSVLLGTSAYSQMANSTNANLSIGYKTAEIGITHTLESEIILGGSISLTDSKLIEKRNNSIDRGNHLYKENSSLTPSAFILMGGNFDRVNLIGKVGATYMNQNVCSIDNSMQTDGVYTKDSKLLYLAIGMEFMYQVSDNWGISGSFDNVNSAMLGINYKIN